MAEQRQRRSTEVRLALVSMGAMLGGLGLMMWLASEQQSQQNRPLYSSKEDCEREWSDHDCEPTRLGGSGSNRIGGIYRGPYVRGYTVDENGKAHQTSAESERIPQNSRAFSVQRGGFGSTGGRFGASS